MDSWDAIFELPGVIEYMPGHAADKGAWCPAGAASRPLCRHFTACCRCQRVQDRLSVSTEVIFSAIHQLAPDTGEIARLGAQHVLDDPFQVTPTPTRSFLQIFPCRRARRGIECLPASLQQFLETPQLGLVSLEGGLPGAPKSVVASPLSRSITAIAETSAGAWNSSCAGRRTPAYRGP